MSGAFLFNHTTVINEDSPGKEDSKAKELLRLYSSLFVLGACTSIRTPVYAQAAPQAFDYRKEIGAAAFHWAAWPQAWHEGSFMGNGMLGCLLYKEPSRNFIRLEICRSDVQDHRDDPFGSPAFSRPRLPIGYFELAPCGNILNPSDVTLDIYNAETKGTIVTDKGSIEFHAIVHAEEMVLVLQTKTTGNESAFQWRFHPADAQSPRQTWGIKHNEKKRIMEGYLPNPPPATMQRGDVWLCTQNLLAGGQTVTAWRETKLSADRVMLVSIAHSFPASTATDEVARHIKKAASVGVPELFERHRAWWNTFYQQSYIQVPDDSLQKFYWRQLYKLGSATRADRALIDNQGPWLVETAWPSATWNLNVQLSYWPVYTSNHLDLGWSLVHSLGDNYENLITNVAAAYRHNSSALGRATAQDCRAPVGIPGIRKDSLGIEPETGLLTWACHNLWLQYRYSMDEALLRDKIFPLLRRSINYYHHFLYTGTDGRLHLPLTYSPELGTATDANFDLALLRWGCQALLQACDTLSIDDPLIPTWSHTLKMLTDFPVDQTGFKIGADRSLDQSHRHYSHLLMAYPLYLVNVDQGQKELITKSLKHWQSRPEALEGYSYTGASSISSAVGDGDEALRYLKYFQRQFPTRNTMYQESGAVIETPLSGAQAILDMLLQSWGGVIRVMPALPKDWQDVSFGNLRAEGSFLVSATVTNGKLHSVTLKSLAGEKCLLKANFCAPPRLNGYRDFRIEMAGPNLYAIDLQKNETVTLFCFCPPASHPDTD